jgi:hypothetical protein
VGGTVLGIRQPIEAVSGVLIELYRAATDGVHWCCSGRVLIGVTFGISSTVAEITIEPTSRETIPTTLYARLSAIGAANHGPARRCPARACASRWPPSKLKPSPLRYHDEHRAEIEAVVRGAARDATFDSPAGNPTGADVQLDPVDHNA